jgi:hypothetical protein
MYAGPSAQPVRSCRMPCLQVHMQHAASTNTMQNKRW